jgi:ActR/RegA family two-component response regulator
MAEQTRLLLSIIELGGYPNFRPLYESLGYRVVTVTRMRKAIGFLKSDTPDVIVAEFNFQSDFRDRTSSLESLLAVVQRMPDTRVIIFYDDVYATQFARLRSRLPVHHALAFPVDEMQLHRIMDEVAAAAAVAAC